jgi:DNA-binding GntR family transcriptional regulator
MSLPTLSTVSDDTLAPPADLADLVYRRLVAGIIDGSLAPGQRLGQEELAARFAVSRQPVLQALQRLHRDELAVESDRRGTLAVAALDVDRVSEIYELRAQLDALAARRAAARVRSGEAAPLGRRLLDAGQQALRNGDLTLLVEADQQFHDAIYAASGNRLIAPVLRSQWMHLERAMAAVVRQHSLRAGVWEEHAAIAEAIDLGDARHAERLARQHAQDAAVMLVERLKTPAAVARRPGSVSMVAAINHAPRKRHR